VRLVGDVDFNAVAEKAAAISPVPGGVGPITDVWLLRNTVWAARLAASVQAAQPSWEGLSVPGDLGAAGLVAAPASSSA
jgi:methylenetetrahydrofolate dehydrogenase (NADP+)/methenyltetrahydrofolate cyclohydrolase